MFVDMAIHPFHITFRSRASAKAWRNIGGSAIQRFETWMTFTWFREGYFKNHMETYMATCGNIYMATYGNIHGNENPHALVTYGKKNCVFFWGGHAGSCHVGRCMETQKNFATFHQKQGIFAQTNMMLYALLKQMFLGGASRHVRGTEWQIFGMVQGDGPGWSWLLDGARVSIGGKKTLRHSYFRHGEQEKDTIHCEGYIYI